MLNILANDPETGSSRRTNWKSIDIVTPGFSPLVPYPVVKKWIWVKMENTYLIRTPANLGR
jgi:hypothetical protein